MSRKLENLTTEDLLVAGGTLGINNTLGDNIGIQAPAGSFTDYTLTLPPNDGMANQFLETDGSGALSWTTVDLNKISDVAITSVADNEVLAYNSGSGDWINQTASEAGLVSTARTITAGVGLSGGGDLSADRTIDLDIDGLTSTTTISSSSDYIAIYDDSASAHRKLLLEDLCPVLQITRKNVTGTLIIDKDSGNINIGSTPTSTSGVAFDSHSITMLGNNTVRFQMIIPFDIDDDTANGVAVVSRSTTVLAVAAAQGKKETGKQLVLDFYDAPGTGTHTYSVRVGCETNKESYFNRTKDDSTPWGGTLFRNNCNITLTELAL